VHEALLKELARIVGDHYVKTEAGDLETYGRDWTRVHTPRPSAIVFPASTAEVSKVVRLCWEKGVPVVPSGGRTGLAGGAIAPQGELVVSLDRMNKIEKLDAVGLSAVVQAGVTTQALQEAAREIGLFFPLDLAAKGSCQIGGNIATNAGGVKFIRFGGMREQVLGLEVVLPDGQILDMNTALRKNNTGYDLKQLFISAEGTLGIVTRATVRLTPPPRNMQVAVMATPDFGSILKIAQACHMEGVQLTAFEFFTRLAHEIVLQHAVGAKTPFGEKSPFYVLLEVEEGPAGVSVMEPLLEKIFEKGLITDAVIAQSPAQFKELWGLRENITESIAAHGHARKNDISLAIDQLEPFIADLEREVLASAPADMKLVLFGHIGDGNLHINYVAPKAEPFAEFQARARVVEEKVFRLLARYKGSISAEHGIGLLKKKDLPFSRSEPEIELMKQLKRLIDPKNLMNPGKIFDL
jgi:FAD/FMN-containing dehydrogenase